MADLETALVRGADPVASLAMQCLNCGGQVEWAGGGQQARCTRCSSLFNQHNGQLTPAAGGAPAGYGAQPAGYGAPAPGYGAPPGHGAPPGGYGAPPGGYGGPQPQHDVGAGTFDMGDGHQLRVKINGMTPENFVKNKASSMIIGWIIGAVILGLIVVGAVGVGLYVSTQSGNTTTPAAAAKAAEAASWDGKSTFTCGGNDVVALAGVTATAGVKAGGNCQLTLTSVSITAPVAIDASANAKITMTGGSVTASTNAVVASANAKVDFVGTAVNGKVKKSGNAKVTGAD